MPPMSETERQKLLLQQEIAKLSGAISRHASNTTSHATSYHPYRGRGGGRGGYSRGGRGRGRGGYSLNLRATDTYSGASSSSTYAPTAAAGPSRSNPATDKEDGEVTPPPDSHPVAESSGQGWVKSNYRGNMSLMTVEKRNALAARPPPQPKPKVRLPPHVEVLQSTTDETPGGSTSKRVVIDGIIYQYEKEGGKLVRLGEVPGSAAHDTPTRQSLKYGGEHYKRTKRGNLISRSSISQRRAEQATKPCRYFTKTGTCTRALTCPYKHDPERIAICPPFLRSACPLSAAECLLSHSPSPHNTPSCSHFQATASCPFGDKCVYPHIRVAADAPVCEPFAREGWCEREAGTCPELHIWECPEWHAKGTCARGKRCGLQHVLRRGKMAAAASAAAESAKKAAATQQGGFDDQSEFIGLPGDVVETSESEEDDDEGGGEDEDDDSDEDDEDSDDGDGEVMEVDSGKHNPSSPAESDDDDDELRVLGEV